MNALLYLANQAAYRIKQFFLHWYVHGYFIFGSRAILIMERLDQVLALRVTWRYFGQPLFKDFTYTGYFLGLIFRGTRILVGILVYSIIVAIFTAGYIFWALIPIFLILKIIIHE